MRGVQHPKVTIGIPTYNGGRSLRRTVKSIVLQGYPNLEIIISDNCSTDNTADVCLALSHEFQEIKYVRQPSNIGLVANFDFVLKQATGRFFMWVADDDTMEPGVLNDYVAFLVQNNDYAMVCGEVHHWCGNELLYCEKEFTLHHKWPGWRVMQYYYKVVQGALYYGLMKRETALLIPIRNRIGDDWHFVASLAYLGKIKNLDRVGYNKNGGGVSKTMKNYAKVIGASWLSANFPHAIIARDAMLEILVHSPVYKKSGVLTRMGLGVAASAVILFRHYLILYPFILGGRVKRTFSKSIVSLRGQLGY